MAIKQKLTELIEGSGISTTIYHLTINALIVVSIFLLAGEYGLLDLGLTLDQYIYVDLVVAVIFLTDYMLRLYVARGKWNFIKEPLNIIDLVAILPSFIGFGDTKSLRVLRVLRLLRLLRIIRLIYNLRTEIKDTYERDSEAATELVFYHELLPIYHQLRDDAHNKDLVEQLYIKSSEQLGKLGQQHQDEQVGYKSNFLLAYRENLGQLNSVLSMYERSGDFSFIKLRHVMREFESMLVAEHTDGGVMSVDDLKGQQNSFDVISLLQITARSVLFTFLFGVVVHILLSWAGILESLSGVATYLLVLEGGMGALIVFITSFNLGNTIKKRSTTDLALITFTNSMNVYARRIRYILDLYEPNVNIKKQKYEIVSHYFDTVLFAIFAGTRKGNKYHLKFDTSIVDALDLIRAEIHTYSRKNLDSVERTRLEEVQDNLVADLNTFQTLAGIRTPPVFYVLNSWLIRVTYFTLVVVAPIGVWVRLLLINFMQRAFFVIAQETDDAIFNVSSASLPVLDRVTRRACRINKILRVGEN